METEKQLIDKTFYKSYIQEHDIHHPIKVLGDIYFQEESNEDSSDPSQIRFAQGEVYFHNKDYEAAIFKWEKIKNELAPWAKKNIGDSYLELCSLSKAEEIYKSIKTESMTLNTEIALQLFSLYLANDKYDSAFSIIKKVVSLNPDYPLVTDMAHAFFEEQQDWDSAVELAVNESIRTESLDWFGVLINYIDQGCTKNFPPHYFSDVIKTLFRADLDSFNTAVLGLWDSYRDQPVYLTYLNVLNDFFHTIDEAPKGALSIIADEFFETYRELVEGPFLLNELNEVIPSFLSNWLKLTAKSNSLIASSAILAWSESFPNSIEAGVVNEAEARICDEQDYTTGLEDSYELLRSVLDWSTEKDLQIGNRSKWVVRELSDLGVHHLLVAGTSGSGKTTFINTMLGENVLASPTSTVIFVKDDKVMEINEITEKEISSITTESDFFDKTVINHEQKETESFVEFKLPSTFLQENGLAIIDTPGFNGNHQESKELVNYIRLADSLLFVLNPNKPFSESERELLFEIKENVPGMTIHFLLTKMDTVYSESEAIKIVEDMRLVINEDFPGSNVFPYSSYESQAKQNELKSYLKSHFIDRSLEVERTKKILFFTRKTIMNLSEKRVEMENELHEFINWNDSIVAKLKATIHQLNDVEKEKSDNIIQKYNMIKEDIKNNLTTTIPGLLKSCSELITEDSDLSRIHIELNEEMNRRIYETVERNILPNYLDSLQEWLDDASIQLEDSRTYLEELKESFNVLYKEDRIVFEYDFKVLDDWKRDTERMINRFRIDEENILLRHTPAQLLLKSASKLFTTFSPNKNMLYNQYKKYVENEEYVDVTAAITRKFLKQFEWFEKSIERDISMFFKDSYRVLEETIEDTNKEIQESQDALHYSKENPELFYDPLTLFEVRLRQYELIMNVKLNNTPYPYRLAKV